MLKPLSHVSALVYGTLTVLYWDTEGTPTTMAVLLYVLSAVVKS